MKLDFASIKKYLSLFTLLFAVVLIGAADKGLEDIINPFNLQDERRFDKSVPLDRFSKPQCGDGAVQKGEVCDPPGSTKRENCKIGGNKSGIRIKTCSNDCSKWNKGQCKPKVICGNGIIEGNENCDDGALNGQYGQCAGPKSSKKLKFGKPQGNVPSDSTGTVKLNITSEDNNVEKCSAPHPAYCGNGRLDYNKKGRPLEACDTVGGRCLFADGKIGSKSCSSYATSTYNSCAADCQSGGGFCGDGEVQPPEECDDGNNSNEDSCSNQCKKIEPPEPKKGPKKCGNGKVEQGEKCDQGKQNGIKCNPKYGKSCTYCSADCQNILTVDPKRFCGNAEIDKVGTSPKGRPLAESCELNEKNSVFNKVCEVRFAMNRFETYRTDIKCSSDIECSKKFLDKSKLKELAQRSKLYFHTSTPFNRSRPVGNNKINTIIEAIKNNAIVSQDCSKPIVRQCVDKGSYECVNKCSNLKDTCTECVKYKGNNSVPKLSVLNPLLAGHESKLYHWGMKPKNAKKKKKQLGVGKINLNQISKWANLGKLGLLNINKQVKGLPQIQPLQIKKGTLIKFDDDLKQKEKKSLSSAVNAIDVANSSTKADVYFGMKSKKLVQRDWTLDSPKLPSDNTTTLSGTPVDIAVAGKGNSAQIYVALKNKNKIIKTGWQLKNKVPISLPAAPTSLGVIDTGTDAKVYTGLENKEIKKLDYDLNKLGKLKLSKVPTTLALAWGGQGAPSIDHKVYVGMKGGKIAQIDDNFNKINKTMKLSATPKAIDTVVGTGGSSPYHYAYAGLENEKVVRIGNNFNKNNNKSTNLSAEPVNLSVAGTYQNPEIYLSLANGSVVNMYNNFKQKNKKTKNLSYIPQALDAVGGKNNVDAETFVGLGRKAPKQGSGKNKQGGGGGQGGGKQGNKKTIKGATDLKEEGSANISLYRPTYPKSLKSKVGGKRAPLLSRRYISQKGEGKNRKWIPPSSYKTLITKNYNGVEPDNGQSIESDKLCGRANNKESEYKLLFNADLIQKINKNEKQYVKKAEKKPNNYGPYGDLFEYNVNGEQGAIKNTVIASPPVGPHKIRVVVRWTKKEGDKFGANSMGQFTSNVFVSSTNTTTRFNYPEAKKNKNISTGMISELNGHTSPFWESAKPSGAPPEVLVHGIGSSDSVAIQSMSLNMYNLAKLEKKRRQNNPQNPPAIESPKEVIPFYVTAVGKPIQIFQEGNIEVLVYTYHKKQDNHRSIYKPTLRFKIDNSTISKNPLAPFWHVFNIEVIRKEMDNDPEKELKGYILRSVDGDPSEKGKELFLLKHKGKNGEVTGATGSSNLKLKTGNTTRKNPNANINHGQITTRFCNIKEYAIGQEILGCP